MEARTSQPQAVRSSPVMPLQAQPERPAWTDVLGAGFALENDMLAIANAVTRPHHAPDPDFNIMEALEHSDLGLDYFRHLAVAQSAAEFEEISHRLRREKRNRELLAGAGWGGFAAGMAGALFSPTMLIPLTGQARGAKGAAQAFGLAATAVTAQELALAQDQLLRTNAETFTGIAAGTVLGGLLGSAVVMLRRSDFERIAAGLDPEHGPQMQGMVLRTPDGRMVRVGESGGWEPDPISPAQFRADFQQVLDELDLNLSPEAARVLEDFTALRPRARDMEGMQGGIADLDAFRNASPEVRAEIEAAFKPIREALRKKYGNYVRLYRWQRAHETSRERDVLSWSLDRDFTLQWGGVAKPRKLFTDEEIAAFQRSFDETGEVRINGTPYRIVRDEEMGGTPWLYRGNESITDVDSVAAWLRSENEGRIELNRIGEEQARNVRTSLVLLDDVVFVTDRGGQLEFIVSNAPGSLARITSRGDMVETARIAKAVADDMAVGMDQRAIPGAASSTAGAKEADAQFVPMREIVEADGTVRYEPITDMVDAGKWVNPGMVGRIAAQVSPVLRATGQTFSPALRRTMQKLSDAGVMWEGNKYGLVAAPGGTVESLINSYQTHLHRGVKATNDAYLRYLYQGEPGLRQRFIGNVLAELNRAPGGGKLSYGEFKAEITRALNRGDQTEVPEAQAAVNELRAIYNELHEVAEQAAAEAGLPPMYGEVRLSGVDSYLNHVFDRRRVAENTTQFIEDIARHIETKLQEAYTARLERMRAKMSEEDDYLAVMQLERNEAAAMRQELDADIKAMKEQLDFNSPNWDRIAELRAEAKAVRETNRAAYDALMQEVRRLEKNMPEPELQNRIDMRKARRKLSALNASIGRLQEKQARALMQLEQIEEANLAALERLTRTSQTLLRRMDRLDDAKLDAELRRLEETFEKTSRAIDRGEERIQKLRAQDEPGGEFEPTEKLSIEQFAQQRRGERFEKQALRLDKAQNFDREWARFEIEQRLQDAIAYTNRVNSRRSERAAKLRERVAEYDPAQVQARIADAMERREARLAAFRQQVQEDGGFVLDLGAEGMEFDFSGYAMDTATKIANQISGSSGRMAQLDQIQSIRGFMKHRMLDLPYEVKEKYLETDIEKVLAMYIRTTAPDIELYRAFGSVNGETALQRVRDDFDRYREYLGTREVDGKGKKITQKQREKALREFNSDSAAHMNELRGVIDRLRNQRGLPQNPDDIAYRLGRFFINWNVPTMMGVAAITSIPDAGRPVMAHGLTRVFRDSWAPLLKSLVDDGARTQTRHVRKQLELMGIGIDTYTQQRAIGVFDLFDTVGRQTPVEKGMEWLALKTPKVALFGQWTDVMKQIAGSATMARVVRGVQDIAEGTADQNTITYLASVNIDQNSARRIWEQLSTPEGGTRYKDLILPNTESWTDAQALRVFKAAMQREDHRIVITPGVERPLAQDANIVGRIVFQFRSFTMAANTKMLISGLQQRNMALFHALQGTVFSLALGTLSYYLWAMTAGERAREEMLNAGWEEWLDQAIYRSGILGAFSEAQVVGASIPATRPFTTFADSDIAGRRATNVMGAVLGPSFGKAQDISQFLVGLDDPTQGTLNQARKLIPYQNVFYLRQALDMVTEGLGEMMNLPERRQ